MSVQINTFFSPDRGDTAKFANVGDAVAGVVTDVQLVPDTFNPGREVLLVKLGDEHGTVKALYVRSPGQREAVGEAVMAAGSNALDVGGRLKVSYVGDKPLSGGKSMKVYSATYTAPQPIGTAELGDVF